MRTAFRLEDVDLVAVTLQLRDRFGETLSESYLDGRTILRDAVIALLDCSMYEAEELVDTLEMNGYLKFPRLEDQTHSDRVAHWRIGDGPRG